MLPIIATASGHAAAEGVTLSMAILDTFPVVFFMLGMGYVIKLLYQKVPPVIFALLCGGVWTGFLGGMLKCVWKFILLFNVDYVVFNTPFKVYQGIGFTMIAIALCCFAARDGRELKAKKNEVVLSCAAPAVVFAAAATTVIEVPGFAWIGVMSAATVVYLVCLSVTAFRRKMVLCGISFLLSMVFMLCMGGLSSKFGEGGDWANINWLAECLNSVTQLLMAVPAIILSKKINNK